MKDQFEDILNLPHPEPTGRTRMPLERRAAEFQPFAALEGFAESIRATEKSWDPEGEKKVKESDGLTLPAAESDV